MTSRVQNSPAQRMRNFAFTLAAALFIVYVFLPYLTKSVDILHRMSVYLDDNGIDPSRYYYTDVEQVKEAELYLDSVLKNDRNN